MREEGRFNVAEAEEVSVTTKTAYGLGTQLAMLALGVVSSIVLARSLGAEGRGILAVVSTLPSIAAVTFSFGLGYSVSFVVAKHNVSEPVVASFALALGLALSTLCVLGLVAVGPSAIQSLLPGLSAQAFWIAVASVPPSLMVNVLEGVLIGAGRIARLSAARLLAAAFGSVSLSLVAWLTGDLDLTLATFAGGLWVAFLVMACSVRPTIKVRRSELVRIARVAFPLGFRSWPSQLFYMLYLRVDTLLLNALAGPAAVGVYSTAIGLAEKLWMVGGAVNQAVFSRLASQNLGSAAVLAAKASRAVLVTTGVFGLGLSVVAFPLIPVLYGDEFLEARTLLMLLIPGIVFLSVGNVMAQFFAGQLGRPGVNSWVGLFILIVGLVAYYLLIPTFGAAGAAIASSIAYSSCLVVWLPMFRRATGMSLFSPVRFVREDVRELIRVALDALRALR